MEMWKMVNDIDRRDIYDDVVVQLAKKEKVTRHYVYVLSDVIFTAISCRRALRVCV